MRLRKVFVLMLTVVMMVMSLAACGTSTTPAEKTKIVYWHTYTDAHEEALKKVIDGFNASQDKYEVVGEQQPYSEFDTKLLQAVRNGTGPDLTTMYPSDAVGYINEGLLTDFKPFIAKSQGGVDALKNSIPAGLYAELTQWGDNIYSYPMTSTGEVLFYNKTLFDKYGIAAPQTWTDVANYSKLIYEKEGIPGFGTDSVTDTYQCLLMQAGSSYIDAASKKLAIDETIGKQKLNWFADGVKAGYFRLVGEDTYFSNPFGSQAVASYIGSSAGISYVLSAVNNAFEVGCVPIPQEGPVKYISQWCSGFVCFSKDQTKAEGVYEFLKYFATTDVVVEWAIHFGSIPVFADAQKDAKFVEYEKSNIAIKALSEEIQYVGMLPGITGAKTVRTEIDKMVQNVALGVMDTDAAYAAFVTAAQTALDGK